MILVETVAVGLNSKNINLFNIEMEAENPREEPRDDPKQSKNKCFYEDRIAKLEAIIAKLLKLMPDLGKPD